MNAMLTLSNQLVALPTHIPYGLQKRLARHVDCLSHLLGQHPDRSLHALARQGSNGPGTALTLHEVVRYLEHPSSGVRRFDQMNEAWRPLVSA